MLIISKIKETAERHFQRYRGLRGTEKTRFLVLVISLLLIMDYLMFCYHTDKNIFNIFPAIPKIDRRVEISIHVPDKDAKNIIREKRRVLIPEDRESYAFLLYRFVVRGSMFDNTSNIVPVKTHVRKIWVSGNNCLIDIDFETVKQTPVIVEGSDTAFRKALEMTIAENIPGVNKVQVLLNGIPSGKLW